MGITSATLLLLLPLPLLLPLLSLGNTAPTGYHIASHKDVIVAGATSPFGTVPPGSPGIPEDR